MPMNMLRSTIAVLGLVALCGVLYAAGPPSASPSPLKAILGKKAPEGVADLRAIQDATKAILKKVMPATVGLRMGPSAGSGVIVSEDGLILTAGHVSGAPGQVCDVILPDGKVVKGKTLGRQGRIDSGMIQITTKGKYPFVEMGNSAALKPGEWCIAVGHPRGYMKSRSPVVRVGRIVLANSFVIQSDCALVGGDSGGPLFDFAGKLIGIHSRINQSIEVNMHVPIDTYRETWDRLKAGEDIGARPNRAKAILGVAFGDTDTDDLVVEDAPEGLPAHTAGVKAGDVITEIDGMKLKKRKDLFDYMAKKRVGNVVKLTVERNGKPMTFSIKLVAAPTP